MSGETLQTDDVREGHFSSRLVDTSLFSLGTAAVLCFCDALFLACAQNERASLLLLLPALAVFLLVVILGRATDFYQSRGTLNLVVSAAALAASLVAAFFNGTVALMLLEVTICVVGLCASSLFERFIGNKLYGILAMLVLATAAIVVAAAAYFQTVLLCYVVQVLLVAFSLIGVAVIRRRSDMGFGPMIDRATSEKRTSDRPIWKRLVCIGSWGVSAGGFFAALVMLSAPMVDKVMVFALAAFVSVWLLVLLRYFSNEYTFLPRFSGALMSSLLILAYVFSGWAQLGGILAGLACAMAMFAGLLGALSERTRIDGVSAVWLFGNQMGFWIVGAFLIAVLAGVLAFFAPAVVGQVVCLASVALTSFAQILVSESAYPSDNIVVAYDEPIGLAEMSGADRTESSDGDAAPADSNDVSRYLETSGWDLSPRQAEVFGLLVKGRNIRYIADYLCVSESTVKTHVHNLYAKLGIHSQQELITTFEEAVRQ